MRRIYPVVLLLSFLVSACSKTPEGVLSEKKMQSVQADIQLAEAMIALDPEFYTDDATKEALFEAVFKKHATNRAEYDSSLMWYGRHLDIYMEVYDRVLNDLSKRQSALGDVQASVIPTETRNDSVDIWPRWRLLVLEDRESFAGTTFDIKPESVFPSGSTFVLNLSAWGIRPDMLSRPEICMSAVQGDTIVSVRNRLDRDGAHQLFLKTVPTKRISRVYGYIRMNNKPAGSYYKIYIDHLNLIRYNYGKLQEQVADSIPSLAG